MPGIVVFGIVPVEAMACGTPAVVYGEGGGAESVLDGRTGIIFKQPTAGSLRASIDSLQTMVFNRDTLRARALHFSRQAFESGFRSVLARALPQNPW